MAKKAASEAILKEALDVFARCEESESENRKLYKEDIKFARLSIQWPDGIKAQREQEQRPMLTINKVAPVVRQVVNDARLNRPAITVRPVDSKADKETAEIITGLIRNIEQTSDADTAYDTAIDNAVSGGFGYFRINLAYASDIDPATDFSQLGPEAFEKDIVIERVINPLSIYGDPDSTAATSEDWNVAFEFEDIKRKKFEKDYPGASLSGFHGDEAKVAEWISDNTVRVAKYWKRTNEEKAIVAVSYPEGETAILALEDYEKRQKEVEAAGGELLGPPRTIPCYKVRSYLMTGAEILKEEDWPGIYIPIIPVYGDEVYSEGKRHLRSIIRDAKDGNRMYNYWRTAMTEMVALAPKAPYIGEEGAFDCDPNWDAANSATLSKLEYKKGYQMPARQPFTSTPTGAMQEALAASDDIKATTGIYDASLGAPSNETSGRAINARQREGDVSSFHFIDNLARSIRHAGRVVLDLIPKVISTPRVARILGEDGTSDSKPINQPFEDTDENGEAIQRIYDLRVGRYDLAVSAGPSFGTRREEAATQMMELIRNNPELGQVIGDILARNLDWPGADEIAKRLEKMLPPGVKDEQGGLPPEVQQQLEQMGEAIQVLTQKLQEAQGKQGIDAAKVSTDRYKAETDRLEVMAPAMGPQEIQAIVIQTIADLFGQELPQGGGPTGNPEPIGLAA